MRLGFAQSVHGGALPSARVTAVSNSASQRLYIEHAAAERRLTNLRVLTADMNGFEPGRVYDRVVSVEMFEHMSNWSKLLGRIRTWLAVDGRLFVHVFTHRSQPYRFDHGDDSDWIAQHFFTGGIMPSHGLMMRFPSFSRSNKIGAGTDATIEGPRSTA